MSIIKNEVRIVALGGLGQIGMNCLLLESAGKLLMIDCGVMFPPQPKHGIDIIHPSFNYLQSRRDDLLGVVLTHGHEDHIAGVPYLLRELDVPIYGSEYTMGLIRERMSEFEHAKNLDAKLFKLGDHLEIGPFGVTTFYMPHSIIQNAGLLLETSDFKILHTGDFKLCLDGKAQENETLKRLRNICNGTVDLMISDSTGAEETQIAGEEPTVLDTLTNIVGNTAGLAVVATFSSNIKRIESFAEVARRTGRFMTLSGRSVENHVRIAESVGALRFPRDVVVPIEKLRSIPRDKILVIVSGTQGEERSSLGRLASNTHKHLHIESGDLVALSSRFIPGNEIAIAGVIDRLLRLGARVLHCGNQPGIHVSGHGSKEEIRAVINTVKPRAFLPAHGTFRHLTAAAKIARSLGVPSVSMVSNGEVIRLTKDGLKNDGEIITSGAVHIDSGSSVTSTTMRDRRILGARGVLHLGWITDDQGMLISEIDVFSRGVISEEAHQWLADQIKEETSLFLTETSKETLSNKDACTEAVRIHLRRLVRKKINREPYVFVTILKNNN